MVVVYVPDGKVRVRGIYRKLQNNLLPPPTAAPTRPLDTDVTRLHGPLALATFVPRVNATLDPKYTRLCQSMTKKLSIKNMHVLAQQRRGKCLSEAYVNNKTKLTWQCEKGHIWEATPHNIKTGYWCPVCGGSKKLNMYICKGWQRIWGEDAYQQNT